MKVYGRFMENLEKSGTSGDLPTHKLRAGNFVRITVAWLSRESEISSACRGVVWYALAPSCACSFWNGSRHMVNMQIEGRKARGKVASTLIL